MDPSTALTDAVRGLLGQIGISGTFHVVPLVGGGNNRVFRIDTGSRSFLLKSYFRHPGDTRDRLGTEFAFLTFSWKHGLRCVPQPLARDPAQGLGLYEFLAGRPMQASDVTSSAVEQAIAFYQELNRHQAEADHLPPGSEACGCLADHLHSVDRRLARFASWTPTTAGERAAQSFVQHELVPRWQAERGRHVEDASAFPPELRCLSPSDFGFHNALVDDEGKLHFVDFEYAGWDGTSKLACDFFCQPALPVALSHLPALVAAMFADSTRAEIETHRIQGLLPVYRYKWVAILLNDFLRTDDERRRFARPHEDVEERRASQLAKARDYFGRYA